jgi:transcriptional regulator with XRE-family HTH domain
MGIPARDRAPELKGRLLPGGKEWVERRMAERGLTVTALASRLGISRKHASNLLNGQVPMTDEMAERLAGALGLDAVLLGCMRHDGVVVTRSLDEIPPDPRVIVVGDINEPMEGWFEDDED